MIARCAWCGLELERPAGEPADAPGESHGMCPGCEAAANAEIDGLDAQETKDGGGGSHDSEL